MTSGERRRAAAEHAERAHKMLAGLDLEPGDVPLAYKQTQAQIATAHALTALALRKVTGG